MLYCGAYWLMALFLCAFSDDSLYALLMSLKTNYALLMSLKTNISSFLSADILAIDSIALY